MADDPNIIFIGDKVYDLEEGGLGKLVFRKMKEYGNDVAQIDVVTGHEDTYSACLERSVRMAVNLRKLGVQKGDIVAIFDHNHMENLVYLVSSLFLGATVGLGDPKVTFKEMVHLIKRLDPKLIFTSQVYEEHMTLAVRDAGIITKVVVFGKSTAGNIEYDRFLEPNVDEENLFEPVEVTSFRKDVAIIVFTSGSTGIPKGICLGHYALVRVLEDDWKLPMRATKILHFAALNWATKLICVLGCVVNGGAMLIIPRYDPEWFWKLVTQFRANYTFMSPSQAITIFRTQRPEGTDVSSLMWLFIGGNRVSPELLSELKNKLPCTRVLQVWGMTETAARIIRFKQEEFSIFPEETLNKAIGTPNTNCKYKFVDTETGKTLGPNQSGELRIKSDIQMSGYFKMDSSDCWDEEGYFKTGDMMYYDENLCIYYVERIGEMFKYRAEYVYPNLIEEVLLNHPSVSKAVVVGIRHPVDGMRPVAVVVLKNSNTTVEGLQDYVKEKGCFPLYGGVVIVDKLPETNYGKIKRKAVKDMIQQNLVQK